ncbi:MAG: FAD-dependent oxidoreductase, partial [Candidatus Promineifilaceae bacterium]
MNKKTNVVVIGAGIIGVSVAYHLAEMGVEDILLIDKGDLDHNDGSTSHAPGGVRILTPSDFFTKLGSRSAEAYRNLPLVNGQQHYFKAGSVQIATTQARFESYKRMQEMGMSMGIEGQLLTPKEVGEVQPMVDTSQIIGGFYLPDAGVVKTSLAATSMRHIAEASGRVTSLADTLVTDIETANGRVRAITTDNPDYPRVECEQVVICTNIWAPVLAQKLGVNMPLYPGQHQYIYTHKVNALEKLGLADKEVVIPMTAMDDISIYFRQHFDHIGVGSYHHKAMLVDPHKLGKEAMMDFTPDDFTDAWRMMQGLLPALKETSVSHGFNGMFSFTVDGFPIVGESQIKGLWTSVGAWLSFAGELGKSLARWMTTGDPGMDMRQADINRFQPFQMNREYLSRQSKYFYEIGFDIIHPSQVASSVRNLRLTPYHDRIQALGGVMVPLGGIESPFWLEANAPLVEKYDAQIPQREGWSAEYWSRIQGAEHLALRDGVGLVDWTAGIGPIEVSGSGATAYLNRLCSSNIDKRIGSISYTLWLTEQGGIKRDVTVVRWEKERYWVLTGKANMPAELAWMRQHASADGSVHIVNHGDTYMSLALWGPNARKVLEKVTADDVSNKGFRFYRARKLDVGMVPTYALRLSYVGELGYEFYAPVNYGLQLWDTLWEAGQDLGMHATGIGAMLSLRLEKGYRLYGGDIHTE